MAISRQLAREQFHQDAKTANELSRAAAQATIFINGGAATALIAFAANVSKETNPNSPSVQFLGFLSYALTGYAFGVLFGSLMMLCLALCINNFMNFWGGIAEGRSSRYVEAFDKWGGRWWLATLIFFSLGMACFCVSSALIALGWYWTFSPGHA